MKHFFKYASGYINIDDQNLYLTSSGNWQEAHSLTEKNTSSAKANKRRVNKNSVFLYGLLALALLATAYMVGTNKLKFLPLLLVFYGLYEVNKHFSKEMGNRYKIPLSKIEAVEPVDGGLKITFRNEAGEPDFEVVKGVEVKGVEVLRVIALIALPKKTL